MDTQNPLLRATTNRKRKKIPAAYTAINDRLRIAILDCPKMPAITIFPGVIRARNVWLITLGAVRPYASNKYVAEAETWHDDASSFSLQLRHYSSTVHMFDS